LKPEQSVLAALQSQNFVKARKEAEGAGFHLSFALRDAKLYGLALVGCEAWDDAAAYLSQAVESNPEQGLLRFNLATAEDHLGHYDQALRHFEESLALGLPSELCGAAHLACSHLARRRKDYDHALDEAEKARSLGAAEAACLNAIGLTKWKMGNLQEADALFSRAAELEPEVPLHQLNRANIAADRRDFDTAFALYAAARALADTPLARRDEAMARLLTGDFEKGWPLYEARLELPRAFAPPPDIPRYNGSPLEGKTLLLMAEQGFGDTIHFCRYGKFLSDQGARLIWIVQPQLTRLLQDQIPGQVLSKKDPLPAADFYIPLLSLPWTTKNLEPWGGEAYLKPAESGPALPPSKGRRIGLVWRGSPTHERDGERSIPLAAFDPILRQNAADHFFALDPAGLGENERRENLCDLSPSIRDFADTARLLCQMDYLISVDTATAHLAGALGVKTFLLLPFIPDWRWGLEVEKTQWYESVTLLRQKADREWGLVINDLARRL
jgi:tetratricopeptide (TPR) repeat protein